MRPAKSSGSPRAVSLIAFPITYSTCVISRSGMLLASMVKVTPSLTSLSHTGLLATG